MLEICIIMELETSIIRSDFERILCLTVKHFNSIINAYFTGDVTGRLSQFTALWEIP